MYQIWWSAVLCVCSIGMIGNGSNERSFLNSIIADTYEYICWNGDVRINVNGGGQKLYFKPSVKFVSAMRTAR